MKILLLGEYSNLHWTLAQGLRALGHSVVVASNGDRFKNYRRDIDISRKSYNSIDTLKYTYLLSKNFRQFKGFDVVQIINPLFLDLKPHKNLLAFNHLKKYNGKVFMGAFGNDAYWLKACLDKETFRYSEFDIPNRADYLDSAKEIIRVWTDKDKVDVNREIAERSDGIIACLYEYFVSYKPQFEKKLTYIPAPINTSEIIFTQRGKDQSKVRFFIGIQKQRNEIKGTDILYKCLQEVQSKYPNECIIHKAESVPYDKYIAMRDQSDVLLDQLYSYTPGMNALTAMAQGLLAVGGGEPEMYNLLNEKDNHPIINVLPSEEDIFNKLENLILNREQIPQQSINSRLFVEQHHDYIKIAQQYLDTWL
ncbi:glycosyltransferase involved in cell wall biosynthesis [Dysgonomonas alginatilytica]|uniref:Glycosyltransferase involved in cell wall biosynthesis n=1 Tax=Dysgonomonas alginatilytica TaxID=1605892 RepID=A0A2V3PSI0_9BACT|nr:glycosyltransferase [Dysgonomonas alginatilytica]PXV68130.1 glycosyltransferase involved in cell wall biosynthesis [Dysgonomonas alginatilytica]